MAARGVSLDREHLAQPERSLESCREQASAIYADSKMWIRSNMLLRVDPNLPSMSYLLRKSRQPRAHHG